MEKHLTQINHSLNLTLERHTHVKHFITLCFFVSCCKIGGEGAKAIGEALKTNTSLTEINLRLMATVTFDTFI